MKNFVSLDCLLINQKKIGKKVIIRGWIRKIRKLGKLLFFDLYDPSGYVQVIVRNQETINSLKKNPSENLIQIWGVTREKIAQKNQIFEKKELEVELLKWKLINKTSPLPFEIKDDAKLNEDTRYRYRYLDLRRNISQKKLILKHHLIHHIRNYLYKKGFIEIETPILAQSSPEGAHCFIVPSRLSNRFYTLPQSPQIFKQLLMIGGIGKYYQIAPSFRDEDARSNRQIEFWQLDLECSFTSAKKIRNLIEKLLCFVIKKTFNQEIKTPFKVLTYQEAIKNYGTDKPFLKEGLWNFVWINKWPFFKYNQENKKYEAIRHPFTLPEKKYIKPLLKNRIKPEKVLCEAFDLVCNGEELLSGSLRIYQRNLQEKILEVLGFTEKEQKKHFDYFLKALEYAAPPHGGFGLGIDRLMSIFLNTPNLKELIAFPKNIDGTCPLTKTPNYLEKNKEFIK